MYVELHIGKVGIQINQTAHVSIPVGKKRVQAEKPQDLSVTSGFRKKEFSRVLQKLREIDSKINIEQKKREGLAVLSVSVLL